MRTRLDIHVFIICMIWLLFVWAEHCCKCILIISTREENEGHKTRLTQRHFIEVLVPSQESERWRVCELGVSIMPLFSTIFPLELFRRCNIYTFFPHLLTNCRSLCWGVSKHQTFSFVPFFEFVLQRTN